MTRAMSVESPMDKVAAGSNVISSLQFGPCWCRGVPSDTGSFDFVRHRSTPAGLGPVEKNLLIVSTRVVEGAQRILLQVYEEVPDPKLVIATATCPATGAFWDALPNGWTVVEDVIPVDLRVEECVSGNPEALLIVFVEQAFGETHGAQNEKPTPMSITG